MACTDGIAAAVLPVLTTNDTPRTKSKRLLERRAHLTEMEIELGIGRIVERALPKVRHGADDGEWGLTERHVRPADGTTLAEVAPGKRLTSMTGAPLGSA
jgi:hypothetical protein